ncbi:MAG TPA: ankyrin repeat domain-containing protein [Xanthomonadales bacterium]|nr:ankyrin repeat domain-containing protein [Xanthomonadales bacterium]
MPSFLRRTGALLSRLRFFVPALLVMLIAAPIRHPAVIVLLLLAQPLFLAGAVSALGYLLETDFRTLALRRGAAFLVLLVTWAAFVTLAVGLPAVRLAQAPGAWPALWLSAGIVLATIALMRIWPAFGLVFLWDDAYPERDEGSWIVTAVGRSIAFARHLAAERDPWFARGLPVALGLLLLASGALSLAGLCGLPAGELHLTGHLLYAFLLCPLVHVLLASRVEHLLLDAAADEDEAAAAAEAPLDPLVLAAAPPLPGGGNRDAQALAAAAANQVELAIALLRQGASADAMPTPEDRDQRSLAIVAATAPDLRLLRELIARGVDLNRAVGGLTPLLAATRDSYLGRPDAVMTLITNGADTRLADGEGNTALHYAALSCDASVAAILLDAHADADVANRDGLTPLGVAAQAGNELLVRFFLERGAKCAPPRALPALVAACNAADDLPKLVKLLLKHKADVAARDSLGRTALHAAALNGHAEMADALIAAGADVDARDAHGVSPLMDAARAGANRVLQRLVFRKPAADALDPAGRDALLIACQSRRANEETVKLLLALGCDPARRAKDGRSALEHAVAGGRWGLVALIDPDYALPTSLQGEADEQPAADAGAPPPDRVALLGHALRHGRSTVAEELFALAPTLTASERAQALLVAANAPDASLAWIGDRLASSDPVLADGEPLLAALLALRPLPFAAIATVLARGAPCGGRLLAPLFEAAHAAPDAQRGAHEALALALLERGADPFARDRHGRHALHEACALRFARTLGWLLARGLDPNAADVRGRTALHELAALPEAEAVPLAQGLLLAGADPERAAADGQTPLGAALAAGRAQLVRWLTWGGTFRHPGRALRADDVPAAAMQGDSAAVDKLLALGLSIDARDAQGCTALLRACGGGREDLVATLLARGADATIGAATGATCLSAAVSARREGVVVQLLDHGVPVNQPLPGGGTPLMVASALGLAGIVELLLARGARIDAADELGNTALHAAAQFCFHGNDGERARTLLNTLLAAKAPVDRANGAGQTPLLLLLGARAEAATPTPQRTLVELVELLLARGADADAQDARGVSCLHAAAMHGLLDAARALLRAGADAARTDRLGRSAHEVALMLGYADVAGELKRHAAGRRPERPVAPR